MATDSNGHHNGNGYLPGRNGNGYHGAAATSPVLDARGLTDHLPPQNLEAERAVLCGCLLDNAIIPDVLDRVTVDDFYRDAHQILMRGILILHAQGRPVDGVTLCEELTRQGLYEAAGGDDYLMEVCNAVPHAANALYHAEIVRQKSISRQLIQSATEVIRDGYSNLFTAKQLLDGTARRFSAIESNVVEPEEESAFSPWPSPPPDAVYQGVAGEIVRAIEPHSEADPLAILGQFLVAVGNLLGRKPHWFFESTRHTQNLFLCVVGDSSKARKGTSWDHVRRILLKVDETWVRSRIKTGMSTGEGVIAQVHDAITRTGKNGEQIEVMPAVLDKRVLFVESEFGGTLINMSREGNNLSSVLRQAWESDHLALASKNNPMISTGAMVSVIGHITQEELHRRLTSVEAANGFGNRFMWVCAKRSKMLPHGGRIHTVNFEPFIARLRDVLEFVSFELDEVPYIRDAAANQLWEESYDWLTTSKPGLLGSMISRSEPQVMRLAVLYAILGCDKMVRRHHLEAALAFWRYCEESARYIFGDTLGDPDSEAVLKALDKAGESGLTRTQINRQCFSGHKGARELDKILVGLARLGLIDPPSAPSGDGAAKSGRRRNAWTKKRGEVQNPARFAR